MRWSYLATFCRHVRASCRSVGAGGARRAATWTPLWSVAAPPPGCKGTGCCPQMERRQLGGEREGEREREREEMKGIRASIQTPERCDTMGDDRKTQGQKTRTPASII